MNPNNVNPEANVTVMRCPVRHIFMPVNQIIIKNLHVTLYFIKYNNSIPFCKEKSCQANKVLIDC